MLCNYPVPAGPADQHPGGMRSAAVNLIQALAGIAGIELHVVTSSKTVRAPTVSSLSVAARLHVVPAPRATGMPVAYLPRAASMRRYLARISPHLVHAQGAEAEYGLEGVLAGVPNVLTVHGLLREYHHLQPPPRLSPLHIGRWAETLTLRRCKHIIAISAHIERRIKQVSTAELYRIPNAVDPSFYQGTGESSDGGQGTVLYCGMFEPRKGLLDLLEALRRLRADGVPARLLVGGRPTDSVYWDRCRAFIREHLAGDVEMLGWLSPADLMTNLQRATCVALPSYAENLPMVMAEAMATGTPVVAYKVGGIPEYVRNGVSGFTVPPGDTEGLTARLRDLLSGAPLARELGRGAMRVAESFRPEVIAEATVDVYRRVLQNVS